MLFANTSSGNEDNFVTVSTGTVNVGNIFFAGASNENSFTTSGAATINITGAGVTGTATGTFTVNTTGATVNYSGTSSQTIRASSYYDLNISGARTTNSITMGNTNVSNTFSNTATFTSGNYIVTGTFNYNGTGAQTVIPFNYNALTISGARTTNSVTLSNSANINVASTFTTSATFTSGAYIVTGTTVNLNGANQNISTASPFAFNNLTCAGSGTKTATTAINVNGTLNIGGGITLNMSAFALGGTLATFDGTGNLNTAEGSATPIPTGRTWPYTVTYNSANSQTVVHGNYLNLSVTTPRFANNITLSNLGTIAISGTFTASATFTTGAFINTGSTIDFNGTGAQTISAFNYNNLTISGARTTNSVTLVSGGTIGIAGTFVSSATFTSGAYIISNNTINYNGTGAQTVIPFTYPNLTISGARTTNNVTFANTSNILIGGNLVNTATFTSGAIITTGNTIDLFGGTQNIAAFPFNNVIVGGSNTKTATGNITVNGILSFTGFRILNMATFQLLGVSSASGSGEIQTQNTSSLPIPENKTWPVAITYNSTAAQTIVYGNYSTLTISGARTTNNVTFSSAGTTAISGTFTASATFTSGVYVTTGSTIEYNGTGSQTIVAINYNNLTISGLRNNSITLASTGTIGVSGTFTYTASYSFGSLINTGSTVNINGTGAQAVPAINYNNLTISGAHTVNNVTLANSGTIGIAGTFTNSATYAGGALVTTGSTINYNGTGAQTILAISYDNLTISGARTTNNITLANSGTIGVAGTFAYTATYTSGVLVNTGSTININGTGAQAVPAINYNNLTISGAHTVNNVTLANSGTIGIAGTFTNSATYTIGTLVTTGSTINYNGTGAQTILAIDYNNLTISGARTTNNVTLANSGTIGVAGTFAYTATYTSGVLVNTGSTININGTGAQAVPAINYNNLTISGAHTVNNVTLANSGTIGIAGTFSYTATYTSGALIVTGSTVNINGTGAQAVPAINYNNLTISGAHTVNNVTLANSGTIGIAGTFTNSATYAGGALVTTGSTIDYNGTGVQTILAISYNNLTVSGARSTNNVTLANSGTIGVAGTFAYTATYTSGVLVNTGSTVNINGTGAQAVPAINYNNLTLSGAHTVNNVTLANSGTIGIAGTFTNSATYTSGALVTTGSTIDYNGTGAQTILAIGYNNLTISGARVANNVTLANAGTIGVAGNFTHTATYTTGVIVNTSSTVSFNGTGAQAVPAINYNNLTITGAHTTNNVTLANSGTIGIAGVFTYTATYTSGALISSGSTVNFNATTAQTIPALNYNNLSINGARTTNSITLSNSATIGIAGILSANATFTSGTYINTGTTIDYNGTGAQTISAFNYNNLTISGTRTANNVTLANAGTINILGNFTHTATYTSGTIVNTGSTVSFSGTGAQAVPAINFNNLTITGAHTTNNVTLANSGTIGIAGTFTNSATYTSGALVTTGSTIDYNGTGAQTILAINYNNLTTSGARTTNSITLANSGTIGVAGNLNNSATFSSGNFVVTSSTVNMNGAAQNIAAFTFNNLTCSGSGSKTLTGTVTVSGALTISANTLLLNDNQLNVNGTLAGTPVFVGSLNSTLTFGGTGALGANVNFSQTSATTRTLKDLVVNRTSSTITLANPLEIIGAVTLSNGTLASGSGSGNLKLISTLSSTARILPVTGTGAITGSVTVERFINASARRFRFLSSPINNGTLEDWRGEIFLTGNNAPNAHQNTTVGGALNWGFDATTGNQPTVFTYNEAVLGSLDLGYTEVKNSTSSLTNVPLTVGTGYRVFIRGDRSTINFLNGINNTQNAVTMNLIGTPNVGDVTMPVTFNSSGTASNDGWCLLGNPYACEYDWNALWDAGNSGGNSGTFYTNIDPTVYVFDPNSNSFKSYSASANSGTISNGIIPSGQAFFVQATAASPSLTFKEQFKVQGAPTFMFKASSADNDEFRLRLQFDAINSDDYIMKFIPNASKTKEGFDIIKLRNSNFNIASYVSDSIYFALDSRPEVKQNDTLFLNVTGVNGTQRIIVQNIPPNKYFYLVDNMLNVMIPLSNDLEYPFQIQTSNTKSFGKNRFYIVISSNATLPVKLNAFAVNLLNRNEAQLNWVTSLEINNSYFEIERSLDGENFEVVGRVKGNGSTSKTINYSYTDNISEIKANVIYYRLNQYDFDGSNELSPVRAINLNGVEEDNTGEKTVQLSPNPVVSKTRLTFNTKITAEIEVKIFSEMGLLVDVIQLNPLTNPGFELDLSALETGMYILEAIDKANHKFTAKFFKQ